VIEGVVHRAVPPAVLGHQGQLDQRADRPVGAQHRVGQLEQRIRPGGQRGVELAAEPGKITLPGQGVTHICCPGVRHTAHRGHRFRLRVL
jgi:hypothetical protein